VWDWLARLVGRRRQQPIVRVVPALDGLRAGETSHANGGGNGGPAADHSASVATVTATVTANGGASVANGGGQRIERFLEWLSDHGFVGLQPWGKIAGLYAEWYCKDNRLVPISERCLSREMTRKCEKTMIEDWSTGRRRRIVHYVIVDLSAPPSAPRKAPPLRRVAPTVERATPSLVGRLAVVK